MPLLALSLSSTSTQVNNFVAKIDWAHPSWDLFIILFFVIAGFLYGLSLGRDRVVVILISIYMALAVVNSAPFIGNFQTSIGLDHFFAFRISTFLVVFILLFLLLSRSSLLSSVTAESRGAWWQVLLFSFLHVGLLISITLSFLPPSASTHLAPLTQKIFVQDIGRFIWIVAPIAALIVIKGGASKKLPSAAS